MNATNFGTNKDFRKTVDIRQKIRIGHKGKKIYLPNENFTYGLPNRPSTPIKDVISNAYGNREENIIRNEYGRYMREKSAKVRGPPKVVVRYYNPKIDEIKKKEELKRYGFNLNDYVIKDEKPMYKMKMFKGVPSKVSQGIRQFKTYYPKKSNKVSVDDGVDKLINKIEGELGEEQQQNDRNYQEHGY